jgi:hypothetical protein
MMCPWGLGAAKILSPDPSARLENVGTVDPVHEALLGAAARIRSLAQQQEFAARHDITCTADDSQLRAVKAAHMMIAYRLAAAEIETLARVHELEKGQ